MWGVVSKRARKYSSYEHGHSCGIPEEAFDLFINIIAHRVVSLIRLPFAPKRSAASDASIAPGPRAKHRGTVTHPAG